MRIAFSSGISKLTEYNSSFDTGILRVAYTGRNRNNSFISKEAFERCIGSIYNCPIVCRYDREADELGSHDIELVTNDDGGIKLVNATHPVGVIPESAKWHWEEIEDDSGIHEYLCIDALIWKRQEAYQKIKDNGVTDESMEITVLEGQMTDGVYVIDRFEFTAFCLLGTAEPCFESASLEMFSLDGFKQQFAEMMQELKESFSLAQPSQEVGIHPQNYSEGGDAALEQKTALMAEFGLTAEMLDFNIDDFSVDELRTKFEQITNPGTPGQNDPEHFALEGEFLSELRHALESEQVEMCWGMDSRYWFWDYDRELSEVYATDATDWNLYGFSYAMDGDHVAVDFESKKRMKLTVAPFDEGGHSDLSGGLFAKAADQYKANDKQWSEKYQAEVGKAAGMEQELTDLRQFKQNVEDEATKAKREQVLAAFTDLKGVEAFEALNDSCAEYTPEELEERCYAIRGRMGTPATFSVQHQPPKLIVEKQRQTKEPYGGVFAKYGFAPDGQKNQ